MAIQRLGGALTGTKERSGVSGFALVTKGKDIDGIIGRIMPVERDMAARPEPDYHFTQPLFPVEWAAYVRRGLEGKQAGSDHLTGPRRRFRVPPLQKRPAMDHAETGARSDDQTWHCGQSPSSAVPQLLSQSAISSPVRCNPVS